MCFEMHEVLHEVLPEVLLEVSEVHLVRVSQCMMRCCSRCPRCVWLVFRSA